MAACSASHTDDASASDDASLRDDAADETYPPTDATLDGVDTAGDGDDIASEASDAIGDASPPFDAGPLASGYMNFVFDVTAQSGSFSAWFGWPQYPETATWWACGAFSATAECVHAQAQYRAGCTLTIHGSCSVAECFEADGGQGDGDVWWGPAAGTLTIAGGSLQDGGVPIAQNAFTGTYGYGPGALFAQGDTVAISSVGADAGVPAFAFQHVIAPGPIVLTSPAPSAGVYDIPTSQDLAVAWSNGEPGARTYVWAAGETNHFSVVFTYCLWDANAGSGTVPKAALAPLQGSSPPWLGRPFGYGQVRTTDFSAGGFPLEVAAMQYAASAATFP